MINDIKDNNIYINADVSSYLKFKKEREEKKNIENRLDSLENKLSEIIKIVKNLEKVNSREAL